MPAAALAARRARRFRTLGVGTRGVRALGFIIGAILVREVSEALHPLQLLQRRGGGELVGVEEVPPDAARPAGTAADLQQAGGRGDQVDEDVGGGGRQRLLDHLAVVNDGRDRRCLVGEAEVGEHPPFEVEEAVALAEADAVDRDGGGAGHHEVEPPAPGDLGQRDRPGEMLHAVEPGGVELGAGRHHAGLHQQEAAVDAIGRHHEGLALGDQPTAQADKAIVRGDEGEAGVATGRKGRHPLRRGLGAFEVGDHLGEIQVKPGIRPGDIVQATPNLLADEARLRHDPSRRFSRFQGI